MDQSKSLIVYFLKANILLSVLIYVALGLAIYHVSGTDYFTHFWLKNDIWAYCTIVWIPVLIIIVNLLLIHAKIISYLENIMELNQRTEEGDFSPFPESCIPNDEVGNLIRGRNRMLKQLENSQSNVESELMGARDRLKRTSKLSSMGEMTIAISQELKTPIMGLDEHIGKLDNLLAHPSEKKLADARDEVNSAQKIIKKMKKLVKQLQAFDSEKEVWENRDLNEVVENLLTLVGKQFDLSEVAFSSEITAVESICYVEANLFKHVVICLISNAVDVLKDSKAKKLGVKTYSTQTEFFIEVADSGPGISPENQKKIFSPFFTTKDTDEPTGMGLSAALDIVDRHKGKLSIESVEGLGTKFIIKLPITIQK